MITASEFKHGMRHLTGAVSIITCRIDGKPAGMTATAICSLTADPPTLLVCINKDATSHGPISRTKRFTVNFLSADDLALARHMTLGDIDLYEVNEAFASVPLAWLDALHGDPARLNVNGGAIALGHPLGASGTKLLATLLHALRARRGRYGLQTMCEGGGLANVTVIESLY